MLLIALAILRSGLIPLLLRSDLMPILLCGATQIEQMQMCPTRSYDEAILQVRCRELACPVTIGSATKFLPINLSPAHE